MNELDKNKHNEDAKCQRCGVDISDRHKLTKFCHDCTDIKQKERSKALAQKEKEKRDNLKP